MNPAPPATQTKLSAKDFASDQEVRWCPGCGDYSILKAVQQTFASIDRPLSEFAVVSGIGCSSRFPYYVSTYGFHTIHGRAPALALGLKSANPDLSVWVITGDGDSLSIGGNHTIHTLRRNPDLNILLFNNRIYGLTKGQYSPTSELGKITKSSPMGSLDHPFIPLALALGAHGTFIARSVDVQGKHLQDMMMRAYQHHGTSFVEILQNCVIFNDGAFKDVTDKKSRSERQIELVHGEPMIFGAEQHRCLIRQDGRIVAALVDEVAPSQILVHDQGNAMQAFELVHLQGDELPLPLGVFLDIERPVYEEMLLQQVKTAQEAMDADLEALLRGPASWTVAP